jgi:hypothetical protein
MIWLSDLSLNNSKIWQGCYRMLVVQFIICIMAPVVLFQDSYIMLGVVAVINLFVHTWSFRRFLRATGAPPGS